MSSLRQRFDDDLFDLCAKDDVLAFQHWVEQHKCNDWTVLLQVTTESDAANIAKYCLQQGAEANDFVLSSMAVCAAESVHKVLVGSGLDINQYIEVWKGALAAAVMHGKLSWVQFCLDKGADPNDAKLDDYRSLLAEAAGNGDIEVMQRLLDYGAHRKHSGALMYAAEMGKRESIVFLRNSGFDINEIGIEEPTDPRTREDVGSALHKAIENHQELVDLLLETDMTLKDGRGRTPIDLAEQLGHWEIAASLLGYARPRPVQNTV